MLGYYTEHDIVILTGNTGHYILLHYTKTGSEQPCLNFDWSADMVWLKISWEYPKWMVSISNCQRKVALAKVNQRRGTDYCFCKSLQFESTRSIHSSDLINRFFLTELTDVFDMLKF